MRLVIIFATWESIFTGLSAIGWQGDLNALRAALEPWKENRTIAVNIDLGEGGVLPKIGMEVFSRWHHPLLVDKFIGRLEEAGLCLPAKGKALRRFLRIPHDGDPFVQTLIAYFKLNYKDGKIVEAKAYLEQTPYVKHRYYAAYAQPVFVELVLTDGTGALPVACIARYLEQCRRSRIRRVRLIGGEDYLPMAEVLDICREKSICPQIVLQKNLPHKKLAAMIGGGVSDFIVDINAQKGSAMRLPKKLHDGGAKKIRLRWFMHRDNAGKLARVIRFAENQGAGEMIVSGMCFGGKTALKPPPTGEQLTEAAKIINERLAAPPKPGNRQETNFRLSRRINFSVPSDDNGAQGSLDKREPEFADEQFPSMVLTVDSCFSPLRAYLGGQVAKKNDNRGVERGCSAGCDRVCVTATGKVSPCAYLGEEEEYESLADYWANSAAMEKFRTAEKNHTPNCHGCAYEMRCQPCPKLGETEFPCYV